MKIVAFEGPEGPRLGVAEGEQAPDTCEVKFQGIGVLCHPIADK
jgi:hypothetical protein